MIVAVLLSPETLTLEGVEYGAGMDLPLNKGQAQQLAKALRVTGIELECRYEDRGEGYVFGRQADNSKDIHGGPRIDGGAGIEGPGAGELRGEQDHRSDAIRDVGGVGTEGGRKVGRPRRNA